MTIQEYKEKILNTITQMEDEHHMNVERIEIVTEVETLGGGYYDKKKNFKMVVR